MDNSALQCFQGFECYFYPGWDGFNANPIDRTGFEIAQKVIKNLPSKFQNPDVAPAVDGSICMEWMFDDEQELWIDTGPGCSISIYYVSNDGSSIKAKFQEYGDNARLFIKTLFEKLRITQ